MHAISRIVAVLAVAASASAQTYFYQQPVAQNGGTMRASQLWIDPTGQNDSDNDAIAWEDFQLAQDSVITRLRWWGDSVPPLGFEVSFFHQDPGTIAVQPDIVAANSGPIRQEVLTLVTQTPAGAGLYQFEADLLSPLFVSGNRRYFVSIVGRESLSYVSWRWAASSSGPNGTFWWQRGLHMYFHLPESRAVALATAFGNVIGNSFCFGDGASGACPCGNASGSGVGCTNSTREGAALVATGSESVAADDLLLTTLDLPASQSCLTFASSTTVSGLPFGDGRRCVAGSVARLGIRNSGPGGVALYGPGLAAYSLAHFAPFNQFLPGSTISFQTWYRDTVGPCASGTNVSSARSIAFTP